MTQITTSKEETIKLIDNLRRTIIPLELHQNEFDEILQEINNDDQKLTFKNSYRKKPPDSLVLVNSMSHKNFNKLKEIFSEICDGNDGLQNVTEYTLAHYFQLHRKDVNRNGNIDDDSNKARYLITNNLLCNYPNGHILKIAYNAQMRELITIVNNIFDTAYFLKKDNPHISDLEAFVTAERLYRDEKMIEYNAYLEYEKRCSSNLAGDRFSDYRKGLEKYLEHRINELAKIKYKERASNNAGGDADNDYYQAEHDIYDEIIIKSIATFCWLFSSDKNHNSQFYWLIAENIYRDKKKEGHVFNRPISQDQSILDSIQQHMTVHNEKQHIIQE